MIVTYSDKGWRVVTQRSHGVLAAQIGAHWKHSALENRWIETLLAIAEHDDAEVELDGENLLTAQGGPLNFNMKTFDQSHCEKLAAQSLTKSRYIALLTSLHMTFLYKKDRSANSFLTLQKKLQTKWRSELGLTTGEVKAAYSLLQWCDALSLLLCQQNEQPEQRSIEISPDSNQKKFHLFKLNDKQLTVSPWPFKVLDFKISFETRTIKQLEFKNSQEFRELFLQSPIKEIKWEIKKVKASSLGLKVI